MTTRKYLPPDTKLIIHRRHPGGIEPAPFITTLGRALAANDFSTSSGTMYVSVELHPAEYPNYRGFDPNINRDETGLYLLEPETDGLGNYEPTQDVIEGDHRFTRYEHDGSTATLSPLDYCPSDMVDLSNG